MVVFLKSHQINRKESWINNMWQIRHIFVEALDFIHVMRSQTSSVSPIAATIRAFAAGARTSSSSCRRDINPQTIRARSNPNFLRMFYLFNDTLCDLWAQICFIYNFRKNVLFETFHRSAQKMLNIHNLFPYSTTANNCVFLWNWNNTLFTPRFADAILRKPTKTMNVNKPDTTKMHMTVQYQWFLHSSQKKQIFRFILINIMPKIFDVSTNFP